MPAHLAPGRIIWADDVLDPAGRNPKRRGIVVLRHQTLATGEVEVRGVAVTGTFPKPLPLDHVKLPWHRNRRVRTLLDKESAAVCSWVVRLTFPHESAITIGGFVDDALMEAIVAKVNEVSARASGDAEPKGSSE
jgi:hypothetical protein